MRKKIIGILGVGVALFLIMSSLSPTFFATKIQQNDNFGINDTSLGYDLSLDLIDCQYTGLKMGIANDFAVYELKYSIGNVGNIRFIGSAVLILYIFDGDIQVPVRTWTAIGLDIKAGDTDYRTYNIDVITNADPGLDEERAIAGSTLMLMLFPPIDNNPGNDFDVGIAKYWREDDDYYPTDPQIDISEPGNITKQGLIDPPYVLRIRERLGWRYEFSYKRAELWALKANISVERLKILGVPLNLMKAISDFLEALDDPDVVTDFWDLWDLLQAAIEAAEDIIEIVLGKPVEAAMRNYDAKQNEFKIWYNEKHWNFNITIKGSIFKCEPNEEITIRCREIEKKYTANQYGNVETYELDNIPCIYYSNEKSNKQHKCIITIIGNKHNDEIIQSRDVLSFSHSDGIIDMDFEFTTNPCCFPAGTKITMADGTCKNIEDIKVGEKVLSYDIENNKFTSWHVKMLGNPIHPVMTINDGLIQATVDHPFYVEKSDGTEGWAAYDPVDALTAITYGGEVLELEVGDNLYSSDGEWIPIEIIEYDPEPIQTYNILSYSGENNYFANGVLVYEEHPPQIMTDYFLRLLGEKHPKLELFIRNSLFFNYIYQYLP